MHLTWQSLDTFLTRARPRRRLLSLLADAGAIVIAWQFTYLFRLGFERWIEARPSYDPWVLLFIVVVYLGVFLSFGVPRGMWRFSGFGEIKRLTAACGLSGAISAAVVMMAQLNAVPRAVLALHPFFVLGSVCGLRMAYRTLYEHMRAQLSGQSSETRRALVLGAGGAARRLMAGIQHDGWVVVGFLDDDPAKQGARVAGVPVLGMLDDLAAHARAQNITHLVIAMPSSTMTVRRRVIEIAAQTGLPVLTVPSARQLQEGSDTGLRDFEPEDLLGRDTVQLDERGIAEILNDKVVLITGAGGSIGSELCRQVARYGPRQLVLYELSEFNLYTIEQELTEKFPQLPLVKLMGDVKDLAHLRFTFSKWQPRVVFHAAAFKHVPLMEEENAWAALRNNTLGTHNAALAAAENGVERFVLISTDKAVNPTNVMGATKRAAEMVISEMSLRGYPTRFMAVRFGNVLGSSGSVIPKFREQINKGGPITVTHPDIIRYFMTVPEASRLVLQAACIGETGQVMVLDMGEPVRIVDLAKSMIQLAGRLPGEIDIVFVGLRPGEKLFEEPLFNAESTLPTRSSLVRVAQLGTPNESLSAVIRTAEQSELQLSHRAVRDRLKEVVPELNRTLPRQFPIGDGDNRD